MKKSDYMVTAHNAAAILRKHWQCTASDDCQCDDDNGVGCNWSGLTEELEPIEYLDEIIGIQIDIVGAIPLGRCPKCETLIYDNRTGLILKAIGVIAKMPEPSLGDTLYNCCTDNRAPDWSEFASIEVDACKDDPDEPGCTIGMVDEAEAQFWTVYGRRHDGEASAITDCPSRSMAEEIAALFRSFQ